MEPIEQFQIKIAEITFSVVNKSKAPALGIPQTHEKFVVTEEKSGITLYTQYEEPPPLAPYPVIFDSKGSWCLYGNNEQRILRFCSSALQHRPYQIAILSPDYRTGTLFVLPWIPLDNGRYYPFNYPVDELIMVNLLSAELGVLVHGCGLIYQGKGILFIGSSGAGKTTIANLWKAVPDTTILSDDRLILRKKEGQVWVYGTPWHGTANLASPQGVPVERIFLIRHNAKNAVVQLPPTQIATELFVCSFPTFWNPVGLAYTLQFLGEIAESVSSYALEFTPDQTTVSFIRAVLEKPTSRNLKSKS